MQIENQLDLLIVMNNKEIAEAYELDAKVQFGLTASSITHGRFAMEYLNSCSDENLPRATLVDSSLQKDELRDYPVLILEHLQKRNAMEYFGYVCFHLGPYERELHRRTGVDDFFEQTNEFGEGDPVYEFMKNLAREKLRE
ncbi:hypothetical protein HN587_00940 [Candidatus Woesearchaeota archaeon]|nr:hypothetical protein [Candidatus Woesearchaeota archaeon]